MDNTPNRSYLGQRVSSLEVQGPYESHQLPDINQSRNQAAPLTQRESHLSTMGGVGQVDSPMKRHLPIRNRERVYNEWAAVLQRQDELAKKKQQEDAAKAKVTQQLYRNELDTQVWMHSHKQQYQKIEDK